MLYRVNLDFIQPDSLVAAYGGRLDAWAPEPVSGEEWFAQFRQDVLAAMRRKHLPVYRMADSEFILLMGRKFNPRRKLECREYLGFLADSLGLRQKANCWGETYSPKERAILKNEYIKTVRYITQNGYLAPFLNDNGLHAFEHYMGPFLDCLIEHSIHLTRNNYIPFHFVFHLLSGPGWQDFIIDKSILVVTGASGDRREAIVRSLASLGASRVQFIEISPTRAMFETIDRSRLNGPVDLCLVAAGAGSGNIMRQLAGFQTACLDVGSFITCFADPKFFAHAVFAAPRAKESVEA